MTACDIAILGADPYCFSIPKVGLRHLLFWTFIQNVKNAGCVSLIRADGSLHNEGLSAFKSRWGAERQHFKVRIQRIPSFEQTTLRSFESQRTSLRASRTHSFLGSAAPS